MGEKHSAVGYLFREGAFLPAQETKPVLNEFGLDLFQHRGSVYEGKTGLQFCSLQQAEDLAGFVEKHGGIEKVQKLIADSLERTGLSPRYMKKAILSVSAAAAMIGGLFYFGWYRSRHGAN